MPTSQPTPPPRSGRDGARPRSAAPSRPARPARSLGASAPAWHESLPLRRIINGASAPGWTLSVVTPTGWACLLLLVATGLAALRLGWQEAMASGALAASGERCDLSPYLPLLRA